MPTLRSGVARTGLGRPCHRLWTAAAISNLGDGIFLTALPLLAATLTRDPLQVSVVFAAGWLPWLLLGLLSGALADRWDRRRVMWTVDAARFAVVGFLGMAVWPATDIDVIPGLRPAEGLRAGDQLMASGRWPTSGDRQPDVILDPNPLDRKEE